MWQLYLGALLFAGPHLWSVLAPASRDGLKQRWGELRFKMAYAAVSLAGAIFLALGYLSARDSPTGPELLYQPLNGARNLALLLILPGFIFIAGTGGRSHIRQWLKHPFSLGVILWSLAHLLANGEIAVVWIFAVFLVIAVADAALGFWRGKKPVFEPLWSHDAGSIAAGVAFYFVFLLGFHPYILGVPVI